MLANIFAVFDDERILINMYKASEDGSFVFNINLSSLLDLYPEAKYILESYDFGNELNTLPERFKCKFCGAYTFSYRFYIDSQRFRRCVNCSLINKSKQLKLIKKERKSCGVLEATQKCYKTLNS